MVIQVKASQVQKLTIISDKGPDPVNVFLEDYAAGQGKTTIECFGESWSCYWGGMGDRKMKQFIIETDDDYLAKKFAPDEHRTIKDDNYGRLIAVAKGQIIADRQHNAYSKEEARELWDEVEDMDDSGWEGNADILSKVFGGRLVLCSSYIAKPKIRLSS